MVITISFSIMIESCLVNIYIYQDNLPLTSSPPSSPPSLLLYNNSFNSQNHVHSRYYFTSTWPNYNKNDTNLDWDMAWGTPGWSRGPEKYKEHLPSSHPHRSDWGQERSREVKIIILLLSVNIRGRKYQVSSLFNLLDWILDLL